MYCKLVLDPIFWYAGWVRQLTTEVTKNWFAPRFYGPSFSEAGTTNFRVAGSTTFNEHLTLSLTLNAEVPVGYSRYLGTGSG